MTAGKGPPAGTPPPPPVDAAVLPAGHRIYEYVIEKPLGGGGFGVTYLARDSNLNLPVALKEYFPADLATRSPDHTVQVRNGNGSANGDTPNAFEWGLERFLDEARALATFRHPNIVRVLRYFRENGTAYIVMEYESGLSLKRWVPMNAPLSQQSVMSIVHPLMDGLEQVHRAGFLHRDIKPDNIYVRADGSPVLLDFGSARRVSGQRDMTNIVSPGFAPFEQYHSQGNQGPWTDVYSLGAVLYWMLTGRKPVESASRVKSDTMMPVTALAEASVYGETMLNAIDWAMQPEETRRPQSVAEFRAAVTGRPAEAVEPPRAPVADAGVPAVAGAPTHSVPASLTTPSGPQRRNLLGTILFLDLVGYSIKSVDNQVALKKLFNELIGKALRGVPEDTRIAIDTGDGAAICFMGDPEEALHSALLLRDLLGQRYGTVLSARIGLHMGPVRVISDINDRVNVIGDGINVAQRVMDFAQPNQVLVSRAYFDVISRITDDTAEMFRFLGEHQDKHGRVHEVYCVENAQRTASATRRQGPSTGYSQTVPVVSTLSDEEVHDVETELARHIGPLSRVLVRKARPLAATVAQLREALAPSIQEPKARELFLVGAPTASSHSQSHGHSQGAATSGRPAAAGRTGPASGWGASGFGPSVPASRSGPTAPGHSGGSRTVPISARVFDLTPDELSAIELALSKYIGPMARMLIKRELGRNTDPKAFIAAVAGNIDDRAQREAFEEAVRRALHRH